MQLNNIHIGNLALKKIKNIHWKKIGIFFLITFFVYDQSVTGQTKNNLSFTGTATASSFQPGFEPAKAIDGESSSGSSWKNVADGSPAWLRVKLPGATEIVSISIQTSQGAPVISDFKIQTILNGTWRNEKEISGNKDHQVTISFDPPLLIDRLQLWIPSTDQGGFRI